MKNSKLILVALFGLLFFNSCKDEDDSDNNPSVSVTASESYKTITMLKNITGISFSQLNDTLLSQGYSYQGGQPLSDEVTLHLYSNENSSTTFLTYEAKEIIFLTAYIKSSEKDTALSYFEKYSQECNAFIKGKDYEYNGELNNSVQDTSFNSSEEFTNYYNENKYNLDMRIESWETSTEGISAQYSGGQATSSMYILMYIDFQNTPPSMLKKKSNTNILKNINIQTRLHKR